ncbi:hypothetical protein [Kineococcus indalonis]|uniref:hypothetical protein n=1 Tax=Kineococcus indalonis TaxID=2696566 RepID=UPI0014120B2F|nr:hypothetical protein [Kineococcus indalonis]NAZ86474.1 hypothetical protein [Kineococcus indalonis]
MDRRARKSAPLAAAAALLVLPLTACSGTSPCAELPAPSAEQVAAASQQVRGLAVEVEVEHRGVDCFVDPGARRWSQEVEEES